MVFRKSLFAVILFEVRQKHSFVTFLFLKETKHGKLRTFCFVYNPILFGG
jgi:hypothetical protein